VAEHFHTLIETGNVYLVSNGTVKKVVMDYNPLSRELESILNQTTIVELCDDNYPIPRETFKFFLISEVKSLERGTIVDLIGAVTSISPTSLLSSDGSGFISQMRPQQLINTFGQSITPKYYIKFVAEHFYILIETRNVYVVSNGTVKKGVKDYNPLPSELEPILNQTTIIELCDDNKSNPRETIKFFLISEIKSLEMGTIVDLIDVVTSISPTSILVTTEDVSGFISQMRHLQSINPSSQSIRLTLWGNICVMWKDRGCNIFVMIGHF